MSETQPVGSAATDDHVGARTSAARGAGRPRDPSRDAAILEQTLVLLAQVGYEGLTIDKVAARVGAARATIYRRWPSKVELVLAAVRRLSGGDVDPHRLPDTGDLRCDLVAMVLPLGEAEQDDCMQILAGVASLALSEDPRLARAATAASVGPWVDAIAAVLQRAVERGEHPGADVAALAAVIPMMCLSRAVVREPIDREFSLALIDGVVIPAMRGGQRDPPGRARARRPPPARRNRCP